jgi:hypothetical protein
MKAGVVGGNFNRFNPDSLGGNDFTINGAGGGCGETPASRPHALSDRFTL